jgi:hypothetical protein
MKPLSARDVYLICLYLSIGFKVKTLALVFGVSETTISGIYTGARYARFRNQFIEQWEIKPHDAYTVS